MRRLWVWLASSYIVITVIAIGLVVLLTTLQASWAFRRFVVEQEVNVNQQLLPTLQAYYQEHGSWQNVDEVLRQLSRAPVTGGHGFGMMRRGPVDVIVADANGNVAFAAVPGARPSRLGFIERRWAVPIEINNQRVGYLYVLPPGRLGLTGPASSFISTLERSVLWAGALAIGLAIVLALGLSRFISKPLAQLTDAARAVAAGDMTQRVPQGGPQEVAELGAAFNQMIQALAHAETLRRNLVADVAHELRTPLTVIQGNLQAILDGVFPLEMQEVATIYDETRLLSRLVNDLRDLAQAEAGQLSLARVATDLPQLIQGTLAGFIPAATEREIDVAVHIPERLPPVDVDPDRIRQVLRNLLDNALRHTPRGGRISVTCTKGPPGFVTVAVSDTGTGIDPDDLPHVFDRFWRADRSRARDTGGAGLGLAICKHLVEAHGGTIRAESTPGQGATFSFTLPVADTSRQGTM